MATKTIKVGTCELPVKEYRGQRVVTLKEVDTVHQRPNGTARKRFNDNKKHMIEGEDYFKVKCSEVRPFFGQTPPNGFNPEADIVLLTESGYLMLVKSFTDDLAWIVQRQLVNVYFKATVKQIADATEKTMSDLEIMCKAFQIQQKTIDEKNALIARHEAKIAADAPAVAFANTVGECNKSITVEKFAKATYDRFGLGRNQMHKALRDLGFLTENRLPYQKWIAADLFNTCEVLRNGQPYVVTMITGKGQRVLYEKLDEVFPRCEFVQ